MTNLGDIERAHSGLALRIDRLWALLHAPAHVLPRASWGALLRAEATGLRADIEAHFASPARRRYVATLLVGSPELSRQAAALEDEHHTVRAELAEIAELVGNDASIEVLKARLRGLVAIVSRHQDREMELFQSSARD